MRLHLRHTTETSRKRHPQLKSRRKTIPVGSASAPLRLTLLNCGYPYLSDLLVSASLHKTERVHLIFEYGGRIGCHPASVFKLGSALITVHLWKYDKPVGLLFGVI